MLSKIIIKLQGDENLKSAEFYICGTNINANLNLTEGKISEAETKNIKEIEAGYGTQVAAIIVPQSVKKNTIFVKIEQNDKIYYYTLPEDKTFAPGNKYEFLLTIKGGNTSV